MINGPMQTVGIGGKGRSASIWSTKAVRVIDERARPIGPAVPRAVGHPTSFEHRGCEPRFGVTPAVLLSEDADQQTPQPANFVLQNLQPMPRRLPGGLLLDLDDIGDEFRRSSTERLASTPERQPGWQRSDRWQRSRNLDLPCNHQHWQHWQRCAGLSQHL